MPSHVLPRVPPSTTGAAHAARYALSQIEVLLVLLLFGFLTGANGFRFSFNSAIPCALFATVLLGLRISNSDRPIVLSAFAWAISGTLVLWFLGAAASAVVHVSNETLLSLYSGYFVPLLIYASLVNRPITESQKQSILVAVAVGAMIPWSWGIVAYLDNFGIPNLVDLFWNRYDVSRMEAYHRVAFGNTSHMALYISISLPPLLVMAVSTTISAGARTVCQLASILALVNMLIIFSRAAFITLIVLLLFWIVACRSMRFLIIAGILLSLLALSLQDFQDISGLLIDRTIGVVGYDDVMDGSISERLDSIVAGWKLFVEYPIVGVGPGLTHTLNEWSIAHQINVQEASAIGICGLAATIAITVLIVLRSTAIALRRLRMETADLAIWSGVLGWAIYSIIGGGLQNLGLLIPWAGLLYGFLALTAFHQDYSVRLPSQLRR